MQKKGKRKGQLSRAFQDFSDFSKSLDGAAQVVKEKRRGPKKASLVQERERMAAVVGHPQYQAIPLKAVQNHLRHTLQTSATAVDQKKKGKQKKTTEAELKQRRYRKKMDAQLQPKDVYMA